MDLHGGRRDHLSEARHSGVSMTARAPLFRFRSFERPPKVWSPIDAFLYNVMTTNIAVSFGTLLVAGAAFYYPLSCLAAAIALAGAFTMVEALVYALLVPTMPRNGGDYLYQTRLLPRWIGSTFSLAGVVVGGALWMAISGWFASRLAVGPFLLLLGNAVNAGPIIRLGAWVLSGPGVVVMGLVATVWSALLNHWGMRKYARVQRAMLIWGVLSVMALITYFLLTTMNINESGFRAIVYRALEVGFERRGRVDGGGAIVQLLPLVAFGLIYPGWVTYQAGEVRRARSLRAQLFSIVGGKAVGVLFAFALLLLPIHHLGEELFGASAYLAINDPASFWYLAPRLFSTTAAPWLGVITLVSLAVAANVWFWLWVPNHTLAASRVLLAMCWDRSLPSWLGRLDSRTGAPTRAILAFSAVAAVACGVAYPFGVWRLTLVATILGLVTFAVTCLAAALMPFGHRELYRDSPAARFEVVRVPVISVAGMLFAGFASLLVRQYVSMGSPMGTPKPAAISAVLIAVLAACLAFYVFLSHRGSRLEAGEVYMFYRQDSGEHMPT